MRLYLIRHAHTQIVQSQAATEWILSPTGRTQALQLARLPMWSEVQQIMVSSEAKTYLTVESVVQQYQLPVLVDARFDELYRPGWVDDYSRQVSRAFAMPDQAAGEWEPATTALARFQAGLQELCHTFVGVTVALVGHGLTLSLYRASLLGKPRADLAAWQQLAFAAVALVDPVGHRLLQDFQATHSPS